MFGKQYGATSKNLTKRHERNESDPFKLSSHEGLKSSAVNRPPIKRLHPSISDYSNSVNRR